MASHNFMTSLALLSSWFFISFALELKIGGYGNRGQMKQLLRSEEEIRWLHEEWLVMFDKSYKDNGEKEKRFQVFKDNLLFIDEHNHPNNNYTYTVGLNELADLTNDEYQAKYLNKWINIKAKRSLSMREKNEAKEYAATEWGQPPAFIDWRTTGAVGPVINQGECGSCWAWTAVSAVEALHHIQTGNLILLSAQELVDCVSGSSCNGGHVDDALEYIANNHGIDTNERYPYTKKDGTCKPNTAKVVSIDARRKVFPSRDERALQKAVSRQPIGIGVEAKGRGFQLYKEGIFNGQCGTNIDHAMLLIGYGTEKGQDYWLIKNTYGIQWGEDGFMRMERNIASQTGKCGITLYCDYPERKQVPKASHSL